MGRFTTNYVDVRIYRWAKDKSERNELLKDLTYIDNNNIKHIVPKGFKTDFASIPQVFHSLGFSPTGKWTAASILHDYLYSNGYKLGISRKKSDKLFYDAMRDSFVNIITANIMWFCVRAFAYFHYRRK